MTKLAVKKNKPHLSAEAIADGAKSGLTEQDMRTLGMRSLSIVEMEQEFGIKAEGYIIPYDDNFCRAKILKRNFQFGEIYKQKYTQKKGTSSKLYEPKIGQINWCNVAGNPAISLCITEGEKKAAAACKAGIPCVAVGGVWCFRSKNGGLLPDFERYNLRGRTVLIAYDSDLIDKPQVQHAEYALSVELVARGATVMRVRLPHGDGGTKVGLDDFLVAHGFPRNVKAAKAAFDELPREKIDPALPPHLTELGNAIRFAQAYGNNLRFVPQLKKWLVCNPTTGLWCVDNNGEAMRCAKLQPYNLRREAEKVENETAKENILKWAQASETRRNLDATLELASSEANLLLDQSALDANIWLLADKGGMSVNLKSSQVRRIEPEDLFTKSLGTIYDRQAKCPLWEKFVFQVANGDLDLIRYLQRIVGLCLTGDTTEQCFFVLFGVGANGKSTFLSTLLALFGDYARQAAPQTFMAQKNDNGPRPDLVRLVGVRLIATSETEGHHRMAEALIKQWTGGEQISTRDMYAKTFEFVPQGKILLATNHKPKIYSTNNAMWRRVHAIPFLRIFSDQEKDPNLAEKLKEELPGILNWALHGCQEWQKHGLMPPAIVAKATDKYRSDIDVLGAWMQENCEACDNGMELLSALYENYKRWADDGEEYKFPKRDFTQRLEDRGFIKHQTTQTTKTGGRQKGYYMKGLKLAGRR